MSGQLIRQDIGPMVIGYLVLMSVLAVGLRMVQHGQGARRLDRAPRRLAAFARPGPGWPRLIIHLAATAAGGYLLLMTVVILYYYGVARVAGSFLESAFTGCALLIGLAAPVFLAASWLAERRDRRAGRRKPEPPERDA